MNEQHFKLIYSYLPEWILVVKFGSLIVVLNLRIYGEFLMGLVMGAWMWDTFKNWKGRKP